MHRRWCPWPQEPSRSRECNEPPIGCFRERRFDILGGKEDSGQDVRGAEPGWAAKRIAERRSEQPGQAARGFGQVRLDVIGECLGMRLVGGIAGKPVGRHLVLAFDNADDAAAIRPNLRR